MREALLVADSGPLIAWAKLGRLEVLRELAARVLVPPAVWREVTSEKPDRADAVAVRQAAWIEVVPPTASLPGGVRPDLGPGEVEAMRLAGGISGSRLLLDDALARREARRLNLRVIGTVGLLVRAEQAGCIPSARLEAEKLARAGYHLAPALLAAAFGKHPD